MIDWYSPFGFGNILNVLVVTSKLKCVLSLQLVVDSCCWIVAPSHVRCSIHSDLDAHRPVRKSKSFASVRCVQSWQYYCQMTCLLTFWLTIPYRAKMMRCRAHKLHWKECVVLRSSARILCSKMSAIDIPRYDHLCSSFLLYLIMMNLLGWRILCRQPLATSAWKSFTLLELLMAFPRYDDFLFEYSQRQKATTRLICSNFLAVRVILRYLPCFLVWCQRC